MASHAAVLSILIRANTSQATTGLLRVNQQLGATEKSAIRTGNSTEKAFRMMGRGADRAISAYETVAKASALVGVGAAAASVKFAVDFDKSMRNVNSIAQLPERRLQRLSKQVRELGGKTAQAPKTLADGLYDLVSSGFSAQQSMVILRKSARAATAGLTDTATSTHAVAAVLNAYHLKAKDAGKVSDELFQTVNRGVISFEELSQTIGDVLPFAASLGVGLDQVGASVSTMTKAGISAPETMTRIKNVMVALIKPSVGAQKAIKATGFESGEALVKSKGFQGALEALIGTTDGSKQAVAKLFPNIRALGGALALTGQNSKVAHTDLKAFANTSGATSKALSQQAKSISYWWNKTKAIGESVLISFGNLILPALAKGLAFVTSQLSKFGQQMDKVFSRKDLSFGEKLQKAFEIAKIDAKPWIDKLVATIQKANIPEKLGQVISATTPIFVKAAAGAGIAAAKTFAGAFANSSAWGKLALGVFLIRKLGLGGLLTRGLKGSGGGGLAGAANLAKPIPVFVTNAAGIGGGGGGGGVVGAGAGGAAGAASKVKGVLKGAGKIGGRLAALDVVINLVDQKGNLIAAAINTAHDLTFGILPKVNVKSAGEQKQSQLSGLSKQLDAVTKKRDLSGIQKLTDYLRGNADEARRFGDQSLGKQYDQLANKGAAAAKKLGPELAAIADSQRKAAGMSDRFAAAIRGLRLKGSKDFAGLVGSVTFGARQILRVGGGKSKQTREEIARQFDIARRRVQSAMDDQVLSVKQGSKLMHDLAVKQLALYGIKAGRVNVVLAKGAGGHQMRPNQRGGYQTGGAPSGDSIPSLLERGEYVVNRKAVSKVGRRALDQLNFGAAPRFQKGGMAGMVQAANQVNAAHFPYSWGGGHERTPAPFEPFDCSGAVSYVLQHGGVKIPTMVSGALAGAGKPGAGPVTVFANAAHTFMRLAGRYFGTSASNPGGGAGWFPTPSASYLAGFTQRHFDPGGGLGNIARVLLQGPPSVALEAGQGLLDRVRGAANARLDAIASTPVGAGDANVNGVSTSGSGSGLMKAISKARGWNFPDWWALDGSETSHGVNLANPTSTARLRGQFLQSNWGKYGPGSNPAANPSMAAQIQSMADYISARYGNPSKAWAFHQAHNFYAKGGLVGLQKGGAPNTTSGAGDTSHPGVANPAHRGTGLASVLKIVRNSKSPKVRKAAVDRMLKKIKAIGLPKGMQQRLAMLATNVTEYGDYADRASQLTTSPTDGSDPVQGVVGGKTQADWLADQLQALFEWRNAIIRAEELVVARREATAKLIDRARKRLHGVQDAMAVAAHALNGPNGYVKQLAQLQKHPRRNRTRIKALKALIHGVNHEQTGRGRVRDNLKDKILPALTGTRSALNTTRGDLLTNLETVQGVGSPMGVLGSLPPIGVLGGQIFDVQMLLRGLNAPTGGVTDTSTAPDTTPLSDALASLLREANVRTAVSEAQFKVFQGVSNMQQFATGGIVQGAAGAAVPAIVHGGEGVFTRDQMAAMGGAGAVKVIVHGDIVSDRRDPIEVLIGDRRFDAAVQRSTRKQARSVRGLPGRPGGLG